MPSTPDVIRHGEIVQHLGRYCGVARAATIRPPLVASFADSALTGWTSPDPKTYEHRPDRGELTLRCDPKRSRHTSIATAATFDDVELALTIRFEPNSQEAIAGFDLRSSGAGSYDFRITGKGVLLASRYGEGKVQDWLIPPRVHPALAPLGDPNRLVIAIRGDRSRVWINGQLAASIADPVLRRGGIAISAFCDLNPVGVTFSELELYEAEAED
jgi:hypothetical protein